MRKVTLYIETSSAALGKKKRICGYILEYITASGKPVTGKAYREGSGTYNQEYLMTIADALGHIREPVELLICGSNRFVLNMIRDRLQIWAEHDFTSNGKPVMNQEEWQAVWEKIKEHKASVQIGKHSYSSWLLTEMEGKKNEKPKRTPETEDKDTEDTAGSGHDRNNADGGDLQEAERLSG